jgi:hypothetical protein
MIVSDDTRSGFHESLEAPAITKKCATRIAQDCGVSPESCEKTIRPQDTLVVKPDNNRTPMADLLLRLG